jgi:hypothetical protein
VVAFLGPVGVILSYPQKPYSTAAYWIVFLPPVAVAASNLVVFLLMAVKAMVRGLRRRMDSEG